MTDEPMVKRLTDDYAAQIRDKWMDERIGCHCQPYRKPCTYHEGMLDGTDIAAQFFLSQLREQREALERAEIAERATEIAGEYADAAERTVKEQRDRWEACNQLLRTALAIAKREADHPNSTYWAPFIAKATEELTHNPFALTDEQIARSMHTTDEDTHHLALGALSLPPVADERTEG